MPEAHAAIIAGSGTSIDALEDGSLETVLTAYGEVHVVLGQGAWEGLVLMPRHGVDHVPAHRIEYRANIDALHQLGVDRVVAMCTVGSMDDAMSPGTAVVLGQLIDHARRRPSSFYHGGDSGVAHVDMTFPFCASLRTRLLQPRDGALAVVDGGTYVCTDGPRLETAAEIAMFRRWGGHVVGMTAMPEAALARERRMHYASIALVVNWAAGTGDATVTVHRSVMSRAATALVEHARACVQPAVEEATCGCPDAVTVLREPQTPAATPRGLAT